MRKFTSFILFVSVAVSAQIGFAQDLLLEDYQGNGPLTIADWLNTETDSEGNANAAEVDGGHASVSWATTWSGLPSTNYDGMDLSKYKTYQVDVMVEEGQPVEEGASFFVQLLCKTEVGYAYWESYIPQTLVPADSKWYRVRVPISSMKAVAGDGAEEPTDLKTVIGCSNGMAFDEDGSKFKFKKCAFDNVTVSADEVEKTTVEKVEEQAAENSPFKE
jgi:hypothetical protein